MHSACFAPCRESADRGAEGTLVGAGICICLPIFLQPLNSAIKAMTTLFLPLHGHLMACLSLQAHEIQQYESGMPPQGQIGIFIGVIQVACFPSRGRPMAHILLLAILMAL